MSVKTRGCPRCLIAIPIGDDDNEEDWKFCPKCGKPLYNVEADINDF